MSGKKRTLLDVEAGGLPTFGDYKMGYTSTYAVAMGSRHDDDRSDEEMLSPVMTSGGHTPGRGSLTIRVTDEVNVTSSLYEDEK